MWPRLLGVAVAIGAQLALYLTLRRIAVATMPAWAHGLVHHHPVPMSTGPAVVGVTVVAAPDVSPAAPSPPFPAPTLEPVPPVPIPPPALPSGEPSGDRP